jgi:Spy/CpxP family protein refolding chaperone
MKRYRMLTVSAVVLVLGLSGLAQEKPTPPAKPGQENMAPQGPMNRLKDALQITPEQEAKLKEHRKAVGEQQKAFAEQMKKVREEMQTLRKDGAAADLSKTNSLIDRMYKVQADRAKAQAKNRADRAKIFTPEQLAKMKQGAPMLQGRMGQGQGMAQGMMRGQAMRPGMGPMMNRGRMMGMPGRGMMMNRGRMMGRQGRGMMMNRGRQGLQNRFRIGRGLGMGMRWRWDE